MPTREQFRKSLEDYLTLRNDKDYPDLYKATWFDVLAFCSGYYGEINLEMVMVVRELQREGKVE